MPVVPMKPRTETLPLRGFPEDFTVTVRQCTVDDMIRLAALFSEQKQEVKDGGMTMFLHRKFNVEELIRERVYCCLVGTSLTYEQYSADGAVKEVPLFEFSDGPNGPQPGNYTKFAATWGKIPDKDLADAIYEAVVQVNPQWKTGEDEGE